MEAWVIWIVVACVLGVGEMVTMGLYLAPFAAGALIAGLVSLAGAATLPAAVVFLAISGSSYAVLRPIARRHRSGPPALRTGSAALVGRPGVVIERIANREGVGSVKIDGEVWTARAYDEDQVINSGQQVQVMEIRGATALVMQ